MRFITSPSTHLKTSSNVFTIVHKHQTTLSSNPSTKPFSRVMLCNATRSSSRSNHKSPLSVCERVRIPRPEQDLFKRTTLSTMSCGCISQLRMLHCKATAEMQGRKRFGTGIIRMCSTAVSMVNSTLDSLVICAPSAAMLANNATHSNAPQKSEEWFALRRDKLTTSTFSTALGFWKGNRRYELWHEKVFPPDVDSIAAAARAAMQWGVVNENVAIEQYKSITHRDVSSLGFAIHEEENYDWLGASPDGLLGSYPGGGILEVKCPYNKGKPELGLPWSTVPFYYMPQVQGLMEILDREWADVYCWTPNGSCIFRIYRHREYWGLISGVLRDFWWRNVVPASELLLLGREEDVKAYEPTPTHRLTGLVTLKSMHLAAGGKLLCKEIAGHVEFYK